MVKKVGQAFYIGVSGFSLSEEEKDFLRKGNIGGVILFRDNYENPAQLAELVNSIQELRDENPFFIGVDQEGGRVVRFGEPFVQIPPMLDLAKKNSPKFLFEVFSIMANELKTCGVNMCFAPVCDILTNPENKVIGNRAFSEKVQVVEKMVSASIRGLQTSGLLACAKHFPGHGGTTKDSHFELPFVKTELEILRKREYLPFIKASKSRVEFMMTAHLVVDAIDTELPCSLSKKAYDIIRDEIKFPKVVITDDLEMQAITKSYSIGESSLLALQAGTDMVLIRTAQKAQEAFEFIDKELSKNKNCIPGLDEKLIRIEKCKRAHLGDYQPIYVPNISKVFERPERNKITQLLG